MQIIKSQILKIKFSLHFSKKNLTISVCLIVDKFFSHDRFLSLKESFLKT